MTPYTKYQGFRPCGFRLTHAFPIQAYVKHVAHRSDPLLVPGAFLNKPGRGLLGNTTYQISRL